ncbi:MAG: helix-turn-helix transcriptional regulator [Betaproteobacteria bacterium]|nr:helix-turn-helix transcriptional regulator [Betaproteobacteria bacterium]
MTFAAALKAEVVRIARKELRSENRSLKKAAAQYRSDIAALKRRVTDLEKLVRSLAKHSRQSAPAVEEEPGVNPRFSAQGLASQRKRLGLSAADFGTLLGVSGQSIYHWEQGKAKPRAAQLHAIHAVRKIGKREAKERLAIQ